MRPSAEILVLSSSDDTVGCSVFHRSSGTDRVAPRHRACVVEFG